MRMFWVALCLAFTTPAMAQVSGSDDPGYEAAVVLWLDGNEAAAIPEFAALAADGNTAAQVLLALIDTTAAYQGEWLLARPRADRAALLRDEGQNWMAEAARSDPLAKAWLALWDTDAAMTVLLDFARMGEMRAASVAARVMKNRQRHGIAALVKDPAFPAHLTAFAVLDGAQTSLPPGPQVEVLGNAPKMAADALVGWITADPLGLPLRATCERLCPADEAQCLVSAYEEVGSYLGLISLGSPAEALIPAERFAASPQGMATVLRTASMRNGAAQSPECLTKAIAATK
jgi:hypothetical protein